MLAGVVALILEMRSSAALPGLFLRLPIPFQLLPSLARPLPMRQMVQRFGAQIEQFMIGLDVAFGQQCVARLSNYLPQPLNRCSRVEAEFLLFGSHVVLRICAAGPTCGR